MKQWNYAFEVPEQKKVRMIVHTDCKNEADDQHALAHHLMTPKFLVKGIIAGHFNRVPQQYGEGHTAQASLEEIHKVLELMELQGVCPVVKGSEYQLRDESTPNPSEGVSLIIEEAMKEDEHPLFVAFQGAITDLASAILIQPEICSRMTAIWIGGGAYPEGEIEFNLYQDIAAANVVMKSEMPLWQIPKNVYKQMAVSLAELQYHVRSCGRIGEYLFSQMAEYNTSHADNAWPHGEIWGLGDSASIAVLLEESERTDVYKEITAPCIKEDMTYSFEQENRKIRVYDRVDARLTISDFYAKLAINYKE